MRTCGNWPCGIGDELFVKGTGATSFNFVSSGGSIGNASIQAFDWTENDTISFTGVEPLSILNAIDINVTGAVNVGSQSLTLESAGFTTLSQTTTIGGGTATAPTGVINAPNGLVLGTGQTIVGRGAINAPIYSQAGSTITLNGNLTLGDANAFDGIDLHGRLNVGAFTVTLNDGYKAVLGSQTTIGTSTLDGTLNAPNGVALEDNQTLVGRGFLNSSSGTFENQGHVQGQSAVAKIKFLQLVTGRGSFANVEFNGGSSLGNSPTLTDMQGTATFGPANLHTVEIGGLTPGSEFDTIRSTGTVNVGGALEIKFISLNNGFTPAGGQSFAIITAASIVGQFSTVSYPPAPLGTFWRLTYNPTSVVAKLVQAAVLEKGGVFYNNSVFDASGSGAQDDLAIAIDKEPLLPGMKATTNNYTNYSKGLNGLVLDIANLTTGTMVAADFEFRIGNNNDPSSWSIAPNPVEVTIRPGAGVLGASRVNLIWNDGDIKNTWLMVKVLRNQSIGIDAPIVLYFGNAVGETGTPNAANTVAVVDITDVSGVRNNPRSGLNQAPINFPYDFNRDRKVDLTDLSIAINNPRSALNGLKLITVPPQLPAGAFSKQGTRTNTDPKVVEGGMVKSVRGSELSGTVQFPLANMDVKVESISRTPPALIDSSFRVDRQMSTLSHEFVERAVNTDKWMSEFANIDGTEWLFDGETIQAKSKTLALRDSLHSVLFSKSIDRKQSHESQK